MRAHKIIISACTVDFRPTLTYQSTSADLRQQRLTSFCAVCGVCLQPFVTKLGIVVHHHEPECHAKKMADRFYDFASTTPNEMVYGETGRTPLHLDAKVSSIRFLA